MLNKKGDRELAYVVAVDRIDPIPGYDRIELATVGGWHCVVGKGMSPGDLAVYFEIDSLLPADDERFAFCEKYKYKVKTQRMCKGAVISQGLLMPLDQFPELSNCSVGDFVTEKLKVTYYEPEDNVRKAAPKDKYKQMAQRHGKLFSKQPFRWLMKRDWGKKLLFVFFGKKKDRRGNWPQWVVKTDEDRVQNVPWILKSDEPWIATEKVDGSSSTFTLKRGRWPKKNQFIVCSRNVAFDESDTAPCYYDTNVYTEMAKKYNMRAVLEDLLLSYPEEDYITIQGEVYGEGIQKRTYNKKEHDLAVFNLIFSSTGRVNSVEMTDIMRQYGVPCVPILGVDIHLPDDVDKVLEMASGESMIDGGMREGIVFRSMDGKKSFKAVSNEYLLKYHS